MQLAGKVAVITGAARGLGRAYAEALAAEGAAIVVADLNDCSDTVAAVASAGGRAVSTTVDVSDANSCEAMAALAMDGFGRIDVLINNAALYAGLKGARFEQLDEAQWDRVMQVNIKGTWLISRAVVDHMRGSGGGSIINIASLAAVFGLPYGLDYVASKAAVIGMTRGMARELGPDHIRVNAVAPGFIKTDMTAKMPKKIIKMMEDKVPIKRWGEPKDVANAYCFLASDEASYISGTVINVDGGVVV